VFPFALLCFDTLFLALFSGQALLSPLPILFTLLSGPSFSLQIHQAKEFAFS
jgi:hypothetical protein